MGFDSGLYVYPKYEEYSIDDYINANTILNFYNNDQAQKTFKNIENYCEAFGIPNMPEEDLKFFKSCKVFMDEFGEERVYKALGTWSSASKIFYEWVRNYKKADADVSWFELSKEDIFAAISYLWNLFDIKYDIKITSIDYSFRLSEDENITLNRCDGVEFNIIDDEGKAEIIREYTSSAERMQEENLGVVLDFDSWRYYTIKDMIKVFIDCLHEVDFENEVIFFEASW